jgi:hypothetical protein
LGNLRANGHPSGGPWRQFHCTSCTGYFLETHGTLLHGKRVAVELMVRVLACLAEGLGIRATARVFEVDPHKYLSKSNLIFLPIRSIDFYYPEFQAANALIVRDKSKICFLEGLK